MSEVNGKIEDWKETLQAELDTLQAEIDEKKAELDFRNYKYETLNKAVRGLAHVDQKAIIERYMGGDAETLIVDAEKDYRDTKTMNSLKISRIRSILEVINKEAINLGEAAP